MIPRSLSYNAVIDCLISLLDTIDDKGGKLAVLAIALSILYDRISTLMEILESLDDENEESDESEEVGLALVNKTLCEYAITNEKTKDTISGKAHHSDVPFQMKKYQK